MSNALISILKLILLALSFLGYGFFIKNKYKIKLEFLPAIIFSSIGVILFLGGLFNILLLVSYIIYFSGFILLLYSIIKYKINFKNLNQYFSYGILFFFLLCIYFIFYLRSAALYAYDDFSHWGTIVKEIQLFNRLPNFMSKTVSFKAYPPMSALFVYYITKFIGNGENKMLMAQMFLTSAFACTIFAFIPSGKKRIIENIIASIGVLVLIGAFEQATSTLLVDTLFPITAFANTIIIIYYKNNLKMASILSFFLMSFTILTKNSGLLFALINIIILLVLLIKNYKVCENKKDYKKIVLYVLLSIVLALFTLFLWNKHVSLVFPPEAKMSNHAMSISNYRENYNTKSKEKINEIKDIFFKNALNPKTRANLIMSTWSASLILLVLAFRFGFKIKFKATIRALIFCNILYISYIYGIYLTHIFSMSLGESTSFISFNRYAISCVIYCLGIFIFSVLYDIKLNNAENQVSLMLFSFSVLGITLYSTKFAGTVKAFRGRPNYFITSVYKYDISISAVEINNNHSYLIYMPSSKKDNGFGKYLTMYKFFTRDFKIITSIESKGELLKEIDKYDHFVIIQKDEFIIPYLDMQK